MMMILFIGIQAVGKSTFYKRRFFNSHVRVNLDMLRTRNRERLLIEACLAGKTPFVIDNTNLMRTERSERIRAAKAFGFEVVGYYFQSKIQDAIKRNRLRPEAEEGARRGYLRGQRKTGNSAERGGIQSALLRANKRGKRF